jgi:hypothetical protein
METQASTEIVESDADIAAALVAAALECISAAKESLCAAYRCLDTLSQMTEGLQPDGAEAAMGVLARASRDVEGISIEPVGAESA